MKVFSVVESLCSIIWNTLYHLSDIEKKNGVLYENLLFFQFDNRLLLRINKMMKEWLRIKCVLKRIQYGQVFTRP